MEMRRIVLTLICGTALLLAPGPAGALRCMPPKPVDWEQRYPGLEAALIVEIDEVKERTDGAYAGSLEISSTVREVLKGRVGERLQYTVSSLNPWGPYYEPGDRIAVVIEAGVISDGRQNICGPWFEPEELRQAAARYGDLEPPPETDPPPAEPPKPDDRPPPPEPVEPGPVDPVPGNGLPVLLARLFEFFQLVLRILGLG
jgi:hypothetical protein